LSLWKSQRNSEKRIGLTSLPHYGFACEPGLHRGFPIRRNHENARHRIVVNLDPLDEDLDQLRGP